MADWIDIQAAKTRLAHKLRRHRNVNGVGLRKRLWRGDVSEWVIVVNLVKPHKWWHRKLPGFRWERWPVEYQVIGEVYAA